MLSPAPTLTFWESKIYSRGSWGDFINVAINIILIIISPFSWSFSLSHRRHNLFFNRWITVAEVLNESLSNREFNVGDKKCHRDWTRPPEDFASIQYNIIVSKHLFGNPLNCIWFSTSASAGNLCLCWQYLYQWLPSKPIIAMVWTPIHQSWQSIRHLLPLSRLKPIVTLVSVSV